MQDAESWVEQEAIERSDTSRGTAKDHEPVAGSVRNRDRNRDRNAWSAASSNDVL